MPAVPRVEKMGYVKSPQWVLGSDGKQGHSCIHAWFLNPYILTETTEPCKGLWFKTYVGARKAVPLSYRILPPSLCFSCVIRRSFHYSLRLITSGWWNVRDGQCIPCLLVQSCASFVVKWFPWSDAMLYDIPCLWIRHSGAGWVLKAEKGN